MKGMFKKCVSLVMALVLVLGLAAPAVAAGNTKSSSEYSYYVALGDGMTYGIGLAEGDVPYYERVAEALGKEEDHYAHGNKRYRVEELRYLLDASYAGDGYTKSIGDLAALRKAGVVKEQVVHAEVITLNAGVNNFSTYIIEQMMYYLENNGAVKYSYDFDQFMPDDVVEAVDNVRGIVLEQLLAAAPDEGDAALEMIDYVIDVAAYALLSYITSFNALVDAIYELNPDVDLYVVGIYNPAQGEELSVSYNGVQKNLPIGEVFGALTELANAYVQILGNRVNDYVYVDAGTPELLIDQLGDKSRPADERVPGALKLELLDAAEDTAVGMVQEMFDTYGVVKSYKEALAIVEEIFGAANDAAREEYVRSLLSSMVVDEVLEKFTTELENYASTYGKIKIERADIEALLSDLDNAKDIAEREGVAEEFVEDLMTKAMVGMTFAGIKIENQQDAYDAIELLKNNSNGDAAAMREAAAKMIMAEIEDSPLKGFIGETDVVDLLEDLDLTNDTNERKVYIKNWMNRLAVRKITEKIRAVNPGYTEANAEQLLADMEADPDNAEATAKNHMLTTGGFHDYMVEKFQTTYGDNGLTLKTYPTFDAFVTAVENAADTDAAKAIVRTEVRKSAAELVAADSTFELWIGRPAADVVDLFEEMDDSATDANIVLFNWLCECIEADPSNLTNMQRQVVNYLQGIFDDAYISYNQAATAAEDAFITYRDGVDEAANAFAEYNKLKDEAADTILETYENKYMGSGETAQKYYDDYLKLRKQATEKVMEGYDEYLKALETGMKSCDQLNEKFEDVFALLREIGEVDVISLNDLVSVAEKVSSNSNYVADMVDNLIQGDKLASDDKTVAYIALRYYLAGSMMIMPSSRGHAQIANNIIKAINTGKDVSSTTGYWANKIIDGTISVYRSARAFWQKPTSASGQVGTIINPEVYVALGGNITTGSNTYVQMLADALAMEYNDLGNFDTDKIYNLALDGLRAEDLLVLVNNNYAGDAYTDGRFGAGYLESLRAEYQANIKDADLITIEIGINNLVTFPMTQTLLAYNGSDVYEMDWSQYIGTHRANQLNKGKDAMLGLLLAIANNDAQCEKALNTVSTAFESMLYSLIGYIFHLDDAVESIAELNEDATIALIGFYNPLNDTYFQINRDITVAGKTVDLSKFKVNVSAIVDHVIDIGNRYLANYVGNTAEYGNANDAESRLLNVKILDTELQIDDTNVSKDLSTLVEYKEITVNGKKVSLMLPEYFLKAGQTAGEALHPNADGHKYIRDQILNALKFEIHADVHPQYNWKYYGEADPELVYFMDDESSLYDIVVKLQREAGEDVDFYSITATVLAAGGYAEVDVYAGEFEIVARPVTLDVVIKDGAIKTATVAAGSMGLAFADTIADLNLGYDGTKVTWNNDNYALTFNVDVEENEIVEGTLKITTNSLSLESEVHYNVKYTITGFDMDQVVEIGLLQFNTKTENSADSTIENASEVYVWEGTMDGDRYVSRTNGIPAAEMGQDVWFKAYVKLIDGTYRYSGRTVYSAARYAKTVLSGNYPETLKALCVSLMDYGTAAQIYFAEQGVYTYTTSMNEFMDEAAYSSYRNLVSAYDASMLDERLPARYSDYGEFDTRCMDINTGSFSLSLLGAISLNAKNYTYDLANVTESGFLFWDHEIFKQQGVLTWDNVAMAVKCDPDGSIEAALTGIAAAQMHETFVGVPYVVINGQYYYGAVSRVSIDYYAQKIIDGQYYTDAMKSLAKYMVVYGEYARAYFGN